MTSQRFCRTSGSAVLRQGVTRAEIIEAILQVALYVGVQAFVKALAAARRAGLAVDARGDTD
ncbi:MAG: carboxymuconolactone decarboxylase family protein [Pseudomonadota bacterium]